MNSLPRVSLHEDEGRLRKLTFIRLMVATLVVGAAIMVLQLEDRALSVVALYSLLGVIYLSTASVYLAFKTGVPFRPLLWLQIYVDITVLAMIVHYSGGTTSAFTILYILPIIMGGIYLQVAGGLATAILAVSIFVIYSVLELSGYIQPTPRWLVSSAENAYQPLLRSYLHIVIFIFTGLLSGHASRYVNRKRRELAAREKELRRIQLDTDSIIRNMSSGLIVTNMTGEIISLNPAAVSILGLSDVEDIKGRLIEDVIPHMSGLFRELLSVLETGTPRLRHELDVKRVDGTVLPIGISISILRGEEGEKRGVIALFQDLTEVHEMREKIRQADRMAAIGELSAAIAHEIRAPLASICGSIEMLSGELELSGDNYKLMDLIIKESDRLDRIITDFLEFARLPKPSFAVVDVGKCLEDAILLFRHSSVMNKGISTEVVNKIEGARIYADDEQIRQVFLSLGLNACESMSGEGNLTVNVEKVVMQLREAGQPEECIKLDFKNDGPLIPDDVLPRIFEPFFTTREGGTGLGLAIAARIIDSHSGLIKVKSEKDIGTVFSVILPVCAAAESEPNETMQEEFASA